MSAWTVPTKSTGDGGGYEKPPAGNHVAVLVAIIDLGTQKREYDGEDKWQHRALFVWELCNEKAQSGRNHVIGAAVTVSMHERSTLRKWVQARRGVTLPDGADFDISAELYQPCLLNVVLGDKGYPRVDGLSALPKGMPVPAATYPRVLLSLDDHRGGAKLPEWVPYLYGQPVADVVRRCREFAGSAPAQGQQPAQQQRPAQQPQQQPAAPAQPSGPPSSSDPNARWDYSDGAAVIRNATSGELQEFMHQNKVPAGKITAKPAGAPPTAAKPAEDWGFMPADVIPW